MDCHPVMRRVKSTKCSRTVGGVEHLQELTRLVDKRFARCHRSHHLRGRRRSAAKLVAVNPYPAAPRGPRPEQGFSGAEGHANRVYRAW